MDNISIIDELSELEIFDGDTVLLEKKHRETVAVAKSDVDCPAFVSSSLVNLIGGYIKKKFVPAHPEISFTFS